MERWLKPVATTAPVDTHKVETQVAAVKTEISSRWDTIATRAEMLKHIEAWLAYGAAEVKGCLPREVLHEVMLEVYREKFPEDFEPVDVKPVAEVAPK